MRRQKAFTILELLVVISIISVLGTIVVIRFTGSQSAARDSRRQSDIRQYQNALEIYSSRNSGSYPIMSSATNAVSLCGASAPLGAIPCTDDPTAGSGGTSYRYITDAAGTRYVLWARLEKTTETFFVCSSGKTSKVANSSFSTPTGGNCP